MTATAGYQVDVAYPGRFHRELMPGWLHAVVTALGHRAPAVDAAFDYCELGCGDGLNLLVAAALHPQARFIGVDLDPLHVQLAQAAADAAGVGNVRFVLGDAAVPPAALALGTFDFVVSHGMWSWMPEAARLAATRQAITLLRDGGIACIGYMSQPGAAVLAPLQRLMREVAASVDGDAAQRATQALAFARRLADAGAGLFAEYPGLARQLEAMARESPAHLAHEFLSGHWQPLHAADVLADFAAAGGDWLGSATPLENIDALSLPGSVLPLLREATTPALAETLKDAARHQSLRRDLFQRGRRALSPQQHLDALDALTWLPAPGVPLHDEVVLDTRIGPVQVPPQLSAPLLRALADGACSHARLRALPAFAARSDVLNQVTQALLWAGCLHPALHRPASEAAAEALASVLAARAATRWTPWREAGTALPLR